MTLRTEAYYRGVAAAALQQAGVTEPPAPIEAMTASLGIPVRAVNLPQFFTGATVYEDGMPVMIINWAKPEEERRVVQTHMLAHILLMLDDPTNAFPRENPDHSDADVVAEELMMPTTQVIDQARLWFNDYRYLARLFGVPEERMLERMRALGLVKGPEGLVWDF